jgi:hypothetical protein
VLVGCEACTAHTPVKVTGPVLVETVEVQLVGQSGAAGTVGDAVVGDAVVGAAVVGAAVVGTGVGEGVGATQMPAMHLEPAKQEESGQLLLAA